MGHNPPVSALGPIRALINCPSESSNKLEPQHMQCSNFNHIVFSTLETLHGWLIIQDIFLIHTQARRFLVRLCNSNLFLFILLYFAYHGPQAVFFVLDWVSKII
jgi:hypothetical protein